MRHFESLETRRVLVSDWQNALLHADVDNSTVVTPIDALIIVNEVNLTGSRSLSGTPRSEGDPFCDVNGDGFLSPLDALIVINALNKHRDPMTLVAGIAPESDGNGNGVVLDSQVVISGQSLPDVFVVGKNLGSGAESARVQSDQSGRFRISLPLALGGQVVQLQAIDEIGRKLTAEILVQQGDIVQDWNAAVLNVVRDWTTTSNDPYQGRIVPSQPPRVARNLAMIHAAMFDAINATSGEYQPYAFVGATQLDASPVAAAAAAAQRVASTLYADADEIAIWNASLAESLATVAEDVARSKGLTLGRQVGDAILALRANDGSTSQASYQPGTTPGDWNRTFPDFLPPLLPQWPNVRPFAIPNGDAFRPAPPPSLDSVEYASAVDEVMRLGRLDSSQRTAEQTEIALFWSDGGGTATPPGHWNRIATDVISKERLPLIESARTMALLNLALADAGIASWDAKYTYDLWRPIDAIRKADVDGNAATVADTSWLPLLKTPPFPTYTSGHSTFSGAAAAVLTSLFGDNYAFTSTADGHTGYAQRPLDPSLIKTRHFTSFHQAAQEAGLSRIYGGIHFNFDNEAGLEAGNAVGEYVVSKMLNGKSQS